MRLTATQLRQYREQGFTRGDALLDEEQLAQLRAQIDREIDRLPAGQRPENMPSLHYENDFLRELFLSDDLIDIAEQILGPDIALFTTYVISKRPGDGLAVNWHQDAAYFPIEPMETFTLWLAVDDSTKENGCMRVLPGSHQPRTLRPHETRINDGSTLPLSLDGPEPPGAVDVELQAGSYSVHDCYLVHGSRPNVSDRRRCGITIKYVPTYISLDRSYTSPSRFDWFGARLYLARGRPNNLTYAN